MIHRYVCIVYSIALPCVVGIMTAVIAPEYVKNLMSGLEYIGKIDPWLQSISEFQPLFWSHGFWNPAHPEQMLSYAVYLFPFILAWLVYRTTHGKSFSSQGELFLLWSIIIGFVCLIQRRYVHQLAVVYSVCLSGSLTALFDSYSYKTFLRRKILILILLILLLYPVFAFYIHLPGHFPTYQSQFSSIHPPLKKLLTWVKKNTPSPETMPSDPTLHQSLPGYGIMAPWSFGHWITYIAERPAIANNFGYAQHGLKASMKFYISEDPDEITNLLQKLHVRYVIIIYSLPFVQDYTRTLNIDKKFVQNDIISRRNNIIKRQIYPDVSFYNLISTQLFFFNPSTTSGIPSRDSHTIWFGNHCFTLIYESEDGHFRLFEFK